jgi:hypothetical protein
LFRTRSARYTSATPFDHASSFRQTFDVPPFFVTVRFDRLSFPGKTLPRRRFFLAKRFFLPSLFRLDCPIAINTKDHNGQEINSSALYQKHYRQAPWFKAVAAGTLTTKMPFTAPGNDVSSGTFIEDIYVDEDVKLAYAGDDGLTLGFSSPVYENGQVVAYWTNRAKSSLVESIIATAYAELKDAGYLETKLTLLDSVGRVIVDYDPERTGKIEIVHDFDVLMQLNLADKGVSAAQEAVARKVGYGWAQHAHKKIEQAAGYTHLKGAMGYPGMTRKLQRRSFDSQM